MSTIAVDNVRPSLGGTAFGISGVAKMLLNYTQTGPTTNDSENVSSVTDNGVGDYTINFTNSFAAADAGQTFVSGGKRASADEPQLTSTNSSVATGSHQVKSGVSSFTLVDGGYAHNAIWGDLA